MKKILKYITLAVLAVSVSGCEDIFNPDTNDKLQEKDYVSGLTELYSGYMGIAACVRSVADQAIFLEGLRGDFLEPTANAPQEFWDIYNYRDVQGNFLADPKGYYDVILNANDYIAHVLDYREKNPTSIEDKSYRALVGGALRFKAWAYLMLAKIYGEAVYLDDPVSSYSEITRYDMMDFDRIILQCIDLIENGVGGIDGKGEVRWSSDLFPGQAESATNQEWNRICPPAQALLAELYLWRGDYSKCKENCIAMFLIGETDGCYRLDSNDYNGDWQKIHYGFSRREHVAVAFFNYQYAQTNRVIKYFSDKFPNKYYLRPTAAAMARFNEQPRLSGSVKGDQHRGSGITFTQRSDGNYIVWKYVRGFEAADKVYRDDMPVSLYRITDIYLFLVEALGNMGRFEEALVFLDRGFANHVSMDQDGNTKAVPPYDLYPVSFFASKAANCNQGIRGRVSASVVGEDILDNPNRDIDIDKMKLDSLAVEESCLESAAEARSYYAMIRMAKRWGDPARKVWARKVAGKYPGGGADIAAKLEADIKNWFIKYNVYE